MFRKIMSWVGCTPLKSGGYGVRVAALTLSPRLSKVRLDDAPLAIYTVPAAPAHVQGLDDAPPDAVTVRFEHSLATDAGHENIILRQLELEFRLVLHPAL